MWNVVCNYDLVEFCCVWPLRLGMLSCMCFLQFANVVIFYYVFLLHVCMCFIVLVNCLLRSSTV